MLSSAPIDGDDWMNIPPIVRETLSRLEEDSRLSRKLTEALRAEHKQVNDLVRHLIDKQTGFEIDAARQQLLSQDGTSSKDLLTRLADLQTAVDKQRRKMKDVQAVVESDHRIQEKLNSVVGEFVERKDAELAQARQALDHLRQHVDETSADLQSKMDQVCASRSCFQDELTHLSARFGEVQQQLDTLRDCTTILTDHNKDTTDAVQHMRAAVTTVQDSLRRSEEQNEQRFDSVLRLTDKSQAVSERQVESVKSDLLKFRLHVMGELENQLKTVNAACTDFSAKVKTVDDNCADSIVRLEDRCAVMEAKVADHDTVARELRLTAGQLQTRVSESDSYVSSLSRRVEQLVTSHEQHATELNEGRESARKLQVGLGRVDTDVTRLREDVRALQGSVTSFTAGVDALSVSREIEHLKQGQSGMRQSLTHVCEVVQRLSHAVERLDKKTVEPVSQSRYSQTTETDCFPDDVLALVTKEREEREAQMSAVNQQTTALKQTIGALSEQILSVDRRCSELTACCRLTTSLHDEYGTALREVRPALVEVETVKRRIAALEADRSSRLYEQASTQSTLQHEGSSVLELTGAVNELKRREVNVMQTVQRLEHRMNALEASCLKPPVSAVAVVTESEPHGTVVARLSADITRTLETALAAETAAATFRSSTENRLQEYAATQRRTEQRLDNLRDDIVQARQELQTLRSHQEEVNASHEAKTGAAVRTALAVVEQQVVEHSNRLETIGAQLGEHRAKMEEISASLTDAQSGNDPSPDSTVMSALQAVESRLQLAESQLNTLRAASTALADTTKSELDALVRPVIARVEALSKTVSEVDVKGQRATGMLTRRLSDVNGQLVAVRESQDHCTARLGCVEEQVAALAKPPSSSSVSPLASTPSHIPEPTFATTELVDTVSQRMETLLADLSTRLAEVVDAQANIAAEANHARGSCDVAPPTVASQPADGDAPADPAVPSFYPRDELEERLENMWISIVSLLARKDDQESVNKKLDGLHRLVGDEMQVHVRRLERDLDNALAEKVSLAELQEILNDTIQVPQ